jgi:putative two-component system response regulator
MKNDKYKILVVDDQADIIRIYLHILSPPKDHERTEVDQVEEELFGTSCTGTSVLQKEKRSIDVTTATQGEDAISIVKEAVEKGELFSVIFMDVQMPPGMDGVKAASEIRKIDPDVEIAIVTAHSVYDRDEIWEIISGGREEEHLYYLKKPFKADEIREMANALLNNWTLNHKVKKKTQEIEKVHATIIFSLASLAELRDDDTGAHLKRVTAYTKLIATELGKLPQPKWCRYITGKYVEDIGQSCILHDIGKVGIPDSILLKPGKLTTEEFAIMKTHSTIGGDVLTQAVSELGEQSFLTLAREIAYYHHEKWDGSGYPKGLKGESIPLSARIMAIADVYDALSSNRPYRKSLPEDTVLKIITEEMGENHFDPTILQVFRNCHDGFEEVKKKFSEPDLRLNENRDVVKIN